MLLREKLNDKEEHMMRVKEENRKMKDELENGKRVEGSSLEALRRDNEQLRTDVEKLKKELENSREEGELLVREREMLEEIADELKSELNFYKQ